MTRRDEVEEDVMPTNEALVNALREARKQITVLKEEVDKLSAPPSTYGVYLSANKDGTVNVLVQGRKAKVNLHPALTAVREEFKENEDLPNMTNPDDWARIAGSKGHASSP